MIEQSRRGFITGLISFAATAPAIVRAASLMPVKAMRPDPLVKATVFQDCVFWISGEAEVSFTPPLPPEMQALLKERINAAYGVLRRSIIENMERQLYRSAGPNPLLTAQISPEEYAKRD